jgi:hypothetical protein
LAEIDVIIGMDGRLRAEALAEELVGTVGDHLVDVHVALRARARLPDDERELVVETPGDHLAGGGHDGFRQERLKQPELLVHQCRDLLDERQRADHFARHALAADAEILQGALRLRAPVMGGRHRDLAEAVLLDALSRHDPLPPQHRTSTSLRANLGQNGAPTRNPLRSSL